MYDLPGFIERRYEKYGPVFRIKAGPEPIAVVLGPDLAQEVLLDNERVFSTELGYRRLAPLFGRGLLQRDFEDHRFQRRIFQTAFTAQALRGYMGIIARQIIGDLEGWAEVEDFRLFGHVKELLLRSGLAVFYGIDASPGTNTMLARAFEDMLDGTLRLFDLDLPGFKMRKALRGRKVVRDYMASLIPERRVVEGDDAFSYLCKERKENGEFFTDEELIDHAGFLLLAAHDTTASLLQHVVFFLTRYPDWLETLRAEVAERSILDLSYEDVRGLHATNHFLDEVLRTHSSTPAIMRTTLRDVELGGVTIPANSYIFLIPGFNHRAPSEWLDPDRFDPDRFARGRREHREHPFNYMPFGGGVHKCIGMHFARMQAALFISHFVRVFHFSTPAGYRPRFDYMPLSKIRDGLRLTLRPRHARSFAPPPAVPVAVGSAPRGAATEAWPADGPAPSPSEPLPSEPSPIPAAVPGPSRCPFGHGTGVPSV